MQVNNQTRRRVVSKAIVEWARDERDEKGDMFATEQEMRNIEVEPMAYEELLKGYDAYRFLAYVWDAMEEEEEKS